MNVCLIVGVLGVLWCVALGAREAEAAKPGLRRYALVVGNNVGAGDEVALRYAERDAQRFGDVLVELGQIPADRVIRLLGADASQLESTLTRLRARMALEGEREGGEALLMFYYSGHAASDGLHMGSTRVTMKRLRGLVGAGPASLRVLILDACHSGLVSRVKGGTSVESIPLTGLDRADSQGFAILTSATAHEKAQESDRLRGSYFTHYLLTGLKGAADQSGDGLVSLGEVYRYAYQETIRATSRARYLQHPTFSYELKGRQDLILTRLASARKGHGRLRLGRTGHHVLFADAGRGAVVAELHAAPRMELAVRPGVYLVRQRTKTGQVFEANVRVERGKIARLPASSYVRVPTSEVIRKGGAADPFVASVRATALAATLGSPMSGVGVGARVAVGADLRPLTLEVGVRWAQRQAQLPMIDVSETSLGLDVAALKIWDVSALDLGVGVRGGVDRVTQTFVTAGLAPPRAAWVGRTSALVRLGFQPHASWSLAVEPSVGQAFVPVEGGVGFRTIYEVNAGVVWHVW